MPTGVRVEITLDAVPRFVLTDVPKGGVIVPLNLYRKYHAALARLEEVQTQLEEYC